MAISAIVATCLGSAVPTHAFQRGCEINYSSGELVAAAIRDGFDFPEYQDFCAWANRNGVSVFITGDQGVLQGRAYGWVAVRLQALGTGFVGSLVSTNTVIETTPSDAVATGALRDAVNGALTPIARDRDRYLNDLRSEEARIARGGALSPK
jgi:hypothetical protein